MENSPVPTFILDTHHPWLYRNHKWLKSYPDVANALCDKSSSLWTNPDPNDEIPADLFSRINIDNNKAGPNRLGWDNAISRLGELRNCPAALEDVRHLHVYIFLHEGKYSNPLVDPKMPSELPGLFIDAFASMPNLERLDWGLDIEATAAFGEEFARRNLTLPTVRHLVPGAQSHYLLAMCPALEILEAGSFFHHHSWNELKREGRNSHLDLVRAASAVSSLKEFLMHDNWSTEMLEEVLKAMPNLVKLTIQGSLFSIAHRYTNRDLEEAREDGELLKRFLSILSKFPKLEHLILPSASYLELGFDGGHWCGNAYHGKSGREYGRSVLRTYIEKTEFAGDMAVKALPHLKTLTIDRDQATLIHKDNGDIEMSWPWTGRVEDYVHEIYPQ
ncbi:hypothetical protein F4811DRAFT_368057 [Daldinia bambusicola]|nr:hypothetical protein F4811DRAFT_368057 [Daldinia bambusicola]